MKGKESHCFVNFATFVSKAFLSISIENVNGYKKEVITLSRVQFWSILHLWFQIELALRARSILKSDQIAVISIQLPLLILVL